MGDEPLRSPISPKAEPHHPGQVLLEHRSRSSSWESAGTGARDACDHELPVAAPERRDRQMCCSSRIAASAASTLARSARN